MEQGVERNRPEDPALRPATKPQTRPSDVEVQHPPDSVRDLERAIVAATLAGRHGTADLLADRLRERLASDRGTVVRLDGERGRRGR